MSSRAYPSSIIELAAFFAEILHRRSKTIRRYAPNDDLSLFQRSYLKYNLSDDGAPQTDCPRFTTREFWAYEWYSWTQGVISTYSLAADGSYGTVTVPDGTLHKEFFATTGWQRGLTTQTETWSGGVRKKWATFLWTQDNTSLSYRLNPRVEETNVYDEASNRRRATISYTSYGLPSDVYEYAANGTTLLRRTHTDYNLSTTYTDRRILGLVSAQYLYDGSNNLFSKVDYQYDWSGEYLADQGNPEQHDGTSYGASFVAGRGNLSSVRRWDVTDPNNVNKAIEVARTGYNTSGSVIFTRDALGHQTSLSYTDSFTDGQPHNTKAYPTTITDPDNKVSTIQYDYTRGRVARTVDPKGAAVARSYDEAGRLTQVTNQVNGAYTRYVYASNQYYVQSYTTINDLNPANEFYTITIFDGADRVRGVVQDHPSGTGTPSNPAGWSSVYNVYDNMGRLAQRSNPTEINSGWAPAGDDQYLPGPPPSGGYIWSQQAYDWQGRPTVTTNQNGTTRQIDYAGCGCAGGEVMTTTDEVGRKQRMTHDPLGRVVKAEIRKLNGSEWETYSTTTNTYNVRDQLTNVKEQVGETGAEQNTVLSYDGHGRLATRQRPIESGPSSYLYNADDTLQTMTDPRGVVTTYSYNNRHLVTNIAYSGGGSGVVALDADTFSYDDAGNRTAMANGVVSKSFVYNQQSQMISETHQFNGLAQAHMLQYEYNLAGQVKKVTDPWDNSVSYAFDKAGDVTAITGTGFADINQWTNRAVSQFASTVKYRAWGGLKSFSNGNFATEKTNFAFNYDERLQMTRFDAGGTLITNHNYYADGRAKDVLKDASSVLDFDRHYGYDHAARLTSATTGNSQPGTTPYHLTYAYDVWGNTTSRTGYHWGQGLTSFAPTYNNNRHTGWTYDAAGNVTDNSGPNVQNPAMKYDAAGRLANFINGAFFAYLNEHGYDGDSQRVHYSSTLINSSPVQSTRSYYLRSSVLGGEIIAEVYESNLWTESNGTKSYIYLNGERLAYQKNAHQAGADKEVVWVYRHPVTNSLYGHNRLNINGQPQDWIHDYTLTDPTGGEVFPYDPGTLPAPENPSLGLVMWGFLDDYGDCYADGVRTPCSLVMNWLERGWAAEAPWGETGLIWDSRTQVWQSPGGFVVDWDNGFFGFVPQGATYGGDGTWSWNAPSSGGGGRRRIGQSRGASVYDDEEADGRLSPQEPRVLPQVPQRHVPLVLPAPPLTPPREYDPRCAINPVTGQPGFTRDPRGVPGNLRPGQGGQGFFRAPRTRRDGTTYPHEGLDISGRLPSLIYASREGVVTRVANDRGGYGNYITIDHLDGTTTRYAHNLINLVRAGTYVQQGRVIALLGQTGNASGQPRTEAHVHFEVRVNGILRDPALWLNLSCTGWQIRPPF